MDIEIEIIGKGKVKAILDDRNPETARIIYDNLPIEGEANTWLDEIYFDVPLKLDYEILLQQLKKGRSNRTGRQDSAFVYFMEIHNPPQMLII